MVVINRRCILLAVINEYYLLGPMLIISPKILEEGTLDPANDKAYIQLTKCFALSDFWWDSLSPTRSSLSARGARRVYMINSLVTGLNSCR